MNEPHDDTRWLTPKVLLGILFPPFAVRSAATSTNELAMLRRVLVSFAGALVLIGVVVVFLATGDGPTGGPPSSVVAAAVVAYGCLSLIAPRLLAPALDCSSDDTLVGGYRTRFFLRIAFADAAALVGFVGFFLTGDAWLYPLGAAFTLIGFVRLAPTDANLEAEQTRLALAGCTRSLRAALARPSGES